MIKVTRPTLELVPGVGQLVYNLYLGGIKVL